MTFDGTQKFTYDAWNRLVSVAHAYRDGSNNVQAGHVWVTMKYDGRGRRISKAITGTGGWDATYKYYYDGDSLIETRNGSDQTLKQHVWGTRYIDELVQISTNNDPADGSEQVCETNYWVCQDANYNVLGIVDSSGVLKERYEYKPYGERTVFFSPGANDVGLYSPTLSSRRVSVSSVDQPYGICEVGHQGLVHDEEVGLVYNRARQLHPALGRFVQRDPLEYHSGRNLQEATNDNPIVFLDWSGEQVCLCTGGPPSPPSAPTCTSSIGGYEQVGIPGAPGTCVDPGPYPWYYCGPKCHGGGCRINRWYRCTNVGDEVHQDWQWRPFGPGSDSCPN